MSKAERTKQFIIEKTAPIFNAKGFAGTSMSDMIAATGLTKGSIYGNFENKDAVAAAAFDYNYSKIVNHIVEKTRQQPLMINKLLVYPETFSNFFKLPFLQEGCPVLNTSTEADDTHPELRKKAIAALALWKKAIVKYIEIGIETKEIKPDVNAPAFAIVLVSLIEGAMMQAKLHGNDEALNITMKHVEEMILSLRA
ncbi:MAG: TetR/AcrR family transcriptional regulator [Flavobacterium sp.]|nr:MAG: TetR/AcrR family transcriptional regulator [Flavobacterium sp.]